MDDETFDYLNGTVHPTPDCTLPEPIRPEGDAGVMVTATCPHCNVLFLLVNKIDGEKWIEAQTWWDRCNQDLDHIHYQYEKYEEKYPDYKVIGFDFPLVIEDGSE